MSNPVRPNNPHDLAKCESIVPDALLAPPIGAVKELNLIKKKSDLLIPIQHGNVVELCSSPPRLPER
ncbi:hypothetical protein [Stieleria varia]|uniref:hypothetical protein n=1 Tax=Stieleria varia TaxID=2528005 RepID=UPI0011B50E47|nr:hypothetical protein [Stieleria varia]